MKHYLTCNFAGDSSGKNKKRRVGAWRDLSRWKPTDDLALITAVKQVGQENKRDPSSRGKIFIFALFIIYFVIVTLGFRIYANELQFISEL